MMRKIALLLLSFVLSPSSGLILAEDSIEQEQAAPLNEFSQAELEQMLAPIALYPDSVLTHILIASTYPLEVIQANRWVNKNSQMEAAEALSQVENKAWDPSVKALVPFPRILERLSDDLDWTQKLGDAFLQNEAQVLQSIQSLRQKADQAGNLDKMDNMQITREDNNIIIQPLEPEVIYVPYYDTRVVYGSWYWPHYQPVYWDWSWHRHHNHHNYYYTPHHGSFSWYPGIHLSTHYYYSAFNWHNHHVIVVDRHHYTSHHYQHRSQIITNSHARRWSHNPTHRRGVAYRNNQIRQRFNSNRPSITQTRITRSNERRAIANRHVNTTRSATARASNTSVSSTGRAVNTRRERLRQQLNNNRIRSVNRDEDTARGNSQVQNSNNRVRNAHTSNTRVSNNRERVNQNSRNTNTSNSRAVNRSHQTAHQNNANTRSRVEKSSRVKSQSSDNSSNRNVRKSSSSKHKKANHSSRGGNR